MQGGIFFQPRDLSPLSETQLRAYAAHCRDQVAAAEQEMTYIDGQLSILRSGVRSDAFWTFGGFALTVGGLISTPISGPIGLGATLAGVGGSLASVKGFLDKTRQRSYLKQRVRNLQKSLDFCRAEQARITIELDKRS